MADDPKITVNDDGTATAILDFETTVNYTLSKCSCRPAFGDYQLSLIPQNYTKYDTIEGNHPNDPNWRLKDNTTKVANGGIDANIAEEQGGADADLNMLGGTLGVTNSTRSCMLWFRDNDYIGKGNSWYLNITSNNSDPISYIARLGFDTDDVAHPTKYLWYYVGGDLELTDITTVGFYGLKGTMQSLL